MKAARTDANHTAIADALRWAGASVHNTHRVGGGYPDLTCGISGMTLLVEVKTHTGTLNANERKFHDAWRGQIAVCRTVEEAVRLVERWRDIGDALRQERERIGAAWMYGENAK